MAWIAVIAGDDDELVRFEVEAQTGWGHDLERHLSGLMSALQSAVDREAGVQTGGMDSLDPVWWPS